jgi:hypothetical protein
MKKRVKDPKKIQRPPKSLILRKIAQAREVAKNAQMAQRQKMNEKMAGKSTRRRNFFAFILLVIAGIVLAQRCRCSGPQTVPPLAPVVSPQTPAPQIKAKATERRSSDERTGRIRRDAFTTVDSNKPTWFETFRRQVLARSPRLSECFNGAGLPGGVRWTARFNVATGEVSDHGLELVSGESSLPDELKACLVDALSKPRYAPLKMQEGSDDKRIPKQPVPVSLVLEF